MALLRTGAPAPRAAAPVACGRCSSRDLYWDWQDKVWACFPCGHRHFPPVPPIASGLQNLRAAADQDAETRRDARRANHEAYRSLSQQARTAQLEAARAKRAEQETTLQGEAKQPRPEGLRRTGTVRLLIPLNGHPQARAIEVTVQYVSYLYPGCKPNAHAREVTWPLGVPQSRRRMGAIRMEFQRVTGLMLMDLETALSLSG